MCVPMCIIRGTYLAPDHTVWRALLQCLGAVDVSHALAEVKVSLLARHHAIYLQQRSVVLLCPLVPGRRKLAAVCNHTAERAADSHNTPQLTGHAHLRYPSTLPPMYSLLWDEVEYMTVASICGG